MLFFFDLGNVLVRLHWERLSEGLFLHSNLSTRDFERVWQNAGPGGPDQIPYELGRIDRKTFLESLLRTFRAEVCPIQEAELLYTSIFSRIDESFSLLERLRTEGHRLILLSNTSEIHFEAVERAWGVSAFFDDMVLSYREGVMKPDAVFFDRALKHAGTTREPMLFLDDLPVNVNAARKAGLPAEVVEHPAKLPAMVDGWLKKPVSRL